jgi:nucleoid-associated protein YgaU
MPDVLKNKYFKQYDRLSRYQSFPYFYNEVDNKYIYGITSQLDDSTIYSSYIVQKGDTWDSLALKFYNNPTRYWVILDFNRIQDPYVEPQEGQKIKIPNLSSIVFK